MSITPDMSPEELMKVLTAALDRGEQISAVRRAPGEPKDRPELPAVASRGFAVYTGDRLEFSRALSRTRLTMRNATLGDASALTIEFGVA